MRPKNHFSCLELSNTLQSYVPPMDYALGFTPMKPFNPAGIIGLLFAGLLCGCAPSSHVLTGTARPPITPDQVKIYSSPPANYQQIAVLDASSKSAFGTGGQKSVDKVVERLKIEAAKLGANGVILEGFQDAQTGSIGSGVGSDSYSNHSAVGVGVGGSLGIYKKTGHGEAIYVPPSRATE